MPMTAATRAIAVTSSGASRRTTTPQAQRDRCGAEGEQPRDAGKPEDLLRPAHEQLREPLVQAPWLGGHRAPGIGAAERPGPAQVVARREVPERVGVANRLDHPQDGDEGDHAGKHLPQQQGQTGGRSAGGTAACPSARAGTSGPAPGSSSGFSSAGAAESQRVGRHRPIIPGDSRWRGLLRDLRRSGPGAPSPVSGGPRRTDGRGAHRARIGVPTDLPSGRDRHEEAPDRCPGTGAVPSRSPPCSKPSTRLHATRRATPVPASASSATTPSGTSSDTPTGTGTGTSTAGATAGPVDQSTPRLRWPRGSAPW